MSTLTPRVDARDKVTGAVRYGTDRTPEGMAFAMLAEATIDKGRVVQVDTAVAEAVPGVLLVLTHIDPEELRPPTYVLAGGHAAQSLQPLLGDRIAYRGQPIALVVADTLLGATEAADHITARYEPEPFAVELDAEGVEIVEQAEAIPPPFGPDIVVGDADAAFADSAVQIDRVYEHPRQHQVPMELLGSVVEWRGDTLVVHEGTQNAAGVRHGLARQLNIDPAKVEVISPYTGGAFGQKNALQPHLGPLAVAARRLGRPVKLVLTRQQTFHMASFRPASRHHVQLGADASGRLAAAIHEVDHQTSRHDLFPGGYAATTARLYGFPNFRGRHRLLRTDTQTPGFMRGPWEHPAGFAFESAMDELAYATGQDPVALRLANDTDTDPVTGQPFSSRYLAECLRRGAERFGWAARNPEPGSMRADDGSLIGWGTAIGAYPASTVPATAHLSADVGGRVTIDVDGHELGQGIRSAIALLVAGDLGVEVQTVNVGVGDTRVAPQHLTAGQWGTATALPAVHAALRDLRKGLGVADEGPVDVAAAVTATGKPAVDARVTTLAPGQPPETLERVRAGQFAMGGPEYPGFTSFSFVAHFVEVRIEPTTRRVRVPRVVSLADCGRVASPVTAASQVRGQVIWGIGMTLRERSEVDPRFGGFVNPTLEEYPITVNADIGKIEVDFIDEPDPLLNPVGVKGLGEGCTVGVAAAICNAVFHATGRRHRRLPIRVEDLL